MSKVDKNIDYAVVLITGEEIKPPIYVGGFQRGEYKGAFASLDVLLEWLGKGDLDHLCSMTKFGARESILAVFPLSSVLFYQKIPKSEPVSK